MLPSNLSNLVTVRLSRAALLLSHLEQLNCHRRSLNNEVKALVGVVSDYHRKNLTGLVLSAGIELLAKFHDVNTLRTQSRAYRWTWFAVGYQCGFAYVISLIVYQLGMLFQGQANVPGAIAAFILLAALIYLLVRKNPYEKSVQGTQKASV